jgi:hypothetical protein
MAKKNIYISDTDLPLIERAEKELGESLSSIFVDCVRKRLEQLEIKPEEMEKIVLEFWDKNDRPTIKKTFKGRWLLNDVEPESQEGNVQFSHNLRYSVALTSKGNLVLYATTDPDSSQEYAPEMRTYSSPEELLNDHYNVPVNVKAMVADEFGKDFEIKLDV